LPQLCHTNVMIVNASGIQFVDGRLIDIDALKLRVSQQPIKRVCSFDFMGAKYWVKRPERRSFLSRLRKGSPTKAFKREKHAFQTLRDQGLPIADVVLMAEDYFVLRDAGEPLSKLARSPDYPAADLERAFKAAAVALHQVHAAGVALGRPNLKDSLWDGNRITFIDLEMFGVVRNMRMAQVFDLLLFAFSCFAIADRSMPQIDQSLMLYRTLDIRHVWEGAMMWLRWTRFLKVCLAFIRLLRRPSRELEAVAIIYKRFTADKQER
jgi:hypothetical protein